MGELAEQLHASVGAISTALRMLTEVVLAERVPSLGNAATTSGCAKTPGRTSTPTKTMPPPQC